MTDSDKINILLVDDRPENLLGLQGILEGPDLNIITAESGNEALGLMMDHDFALVLLDVQMPDMDGFETVEIMRKNSRTKQLPIIFVTAINKAKEYIFRGYELGAIDYICKPIDPDVLITKVNSILAHEKTRRDLKRTVGELVLEINRRKETEAALREYEIIVATANDLLSLLDRNYTYRVVNTAYLNTHCKQAEDIIGHTVEELLGKEIFEKAVKANLDKCLAGDVVNYQAWFTFPTLGKRFMDVGYYPVFERDGAVSGIVVNSRDITRIKELEEQSIEVRKMQAVGTLAGGVAHKFNNALGAIKGNLELLKMDFPDNGDINSFADRMLASTDEMAGLTSKLIAFAEQGKYQPGRVSVMPLVEETISLIKHQVEPGVAMKISCGEEIRDIEADMTQLQMALSAVIMNGAEAVENGGIVHVSIKNQRLESPREGLESGDYVCLTVEDNGRGMDKETKERIFEPFFTTNFQGRGLSMSAVYGIIRNHHGHIAVESKPGVGTAVTMHLPAMKRAGPVASVPEKNPEPEPKGLGTVLLIEDEDIVLEVNTAMLERLGYSVLTAETGREAIEFAETYQGEINLALLDIGLPDMDGDELFPHLIAARPRMKVIVCSGYSMDSGARNILDAGASGFLQKPFAFAALAEMLKKNIERRKYHRFSVNEAYFSGNDMEGANDVRIVDISRGGLAFQADGTVSDEEGLLRIAVIMGEKGLDMKKSPCRIVAERTLSTDGKTVKRKSVSFGEMSEEQLETLVRIIDNCASDEDA